MRQSRPVSLSLAVSLAVAIFGTLFGACSSAPTTHYYLLSPTRPAPATSAEATGTVGLTIGVEPFTVDPPYDRDQLVYRLGTDSVEVGFYTYHRWAAPLGDLVAVSIAEGLRDTPGIDRIEPVTSGGDYAAFLRGRVLYLEEIDTPGQQMARLGLELRLISRDGKTLWTAEVEGSAAGSNETVAGIVEQLYQAFDQALEQARSGLAAADLSKGEV
jgi:uncharacterized lipoprotein YmbA